MTTDPAIVLFAHGARDPAWAAPLERLAARIARERPGTRVRVAFLELQEPRLRECLEELAGAGVAAIDIAPIFWSQGGHIVQDLAKLVEEFQARHGAVRLGILPVLAELPGMEEFLAGAILARVQG
jgi:sirohydrochlorin cobaltochelatase